MHVARVCDHEQSTRSVVTCVSFRAYQLLQLVYRYRYWYFEYWWFDLYMYWVG